MPLFGLLLVTLDVTLTSTISAAISSDFDTLSLVSWLGSAYLVSMTIVQSLSGSLTDRFGRRSGFFVGLLLFGSGNLLCGLAPNASVLIIARAIAGAGGGAVNSVTTFVISDLVPLRRRPFWQGLGNVAWAVGMGLGGVTGGIINDLAGWRWSFLALTPFVSLVAVGSYFTFVRGLPRLDVYADASEKKSNAIDYIGSLMLTGLLICLVIGLNLMEEGIPKDAKTRSLTLALLTAASMFLVALVLVEKHVATNPVIPLHLLTNRSVISSCLSGFFIASSMHTLLYHVPLLIQVQGYTTSQVGIQMLGEPIGAAIGPLLVGLAIRELGSYTLLKPLSWIIYTLAPLTFYLSSISTPANITILGLAATGAGFGSVLTVNLTGLLANVDPSQSAKSTAMAYVFRQSGASVGLAVAGLIFRSQVAGNTFAAAIAGNSSSTTPASRSDQSIVTQCARSNFINNGQRPEICVVYANALHSVFLMTLVAAIIAAVFGMLIRSQPLDRDELNEGAEQHDTCNEEER